MSGVLYHFFLVACFVSIVKTDPKIEKVTQHQANFTHTITTLSEARSLLAATSSGDLVIFGGGINGTETSDRVDIFNVTSGSWKTATLSIPCSVTTATSSGNLIFFGGDRNKRLGYCNRVDIYNISNATWRTALLVNLVSILLLLLLEISFSLQVASYIRLVPPMLSIFIM
jgi:hypothetical protein